MLRLGRIGVVAIGLLAVSPARAGDVEVDVTDGAGHAVADAVVSLTLADPSSSAGPAATSAVIDQRNETFIPLVTVLRIGGQLIFRNSDTTRHHVYSFSAIKQFQFVLNPGDQSPPVTFDKPGVAAIGCNIHDHMIAYVYAAASPWTAVSDAQGAVRFSAVPSGQAVMQVWHPALLPGADAPRQTLEIGAKSQSLPVTLRLRMLAPMNSHHSMDY